MITSLLPGLRDLRAPLVSGTLLLFAIALVFGGHVDSMSTRNGRSDRLDDLLSWIGRPGLLVAALMAAYLVGSLLVTLTRRLTRYSNRAAIYNAYFMDSEALAPVRISDVSRFEWIIPVDLLDSVRLDVQSHFKRWPRLLPFGRESVVSMVVEYERVASTPAVDDTPLRAGVPLLEVLRETLSDGGRRLRLASVDLYSDYDRPQAEAELRDSIVLALPVAVMAVLFNTSLSVPTEVVLIMVVSLVLAMLSLQARQLDQEANSLLLGALADHTISVPTLDVLDWQFSSRAR